MSKGKPIPKFKSEAEERAFWEDPNTDMDDYFDPEGERRYEDHVSPPTRAISLRLTVPMIEELKRLGGERDVPYQTLIKMYLGDRLDEELGRGRHAAKSRKPSQRPLPPLNDNDQPTARRKSDVLRKTKAG